MCPKYAMPHNHPQTEPLRYPHSFGTPQQKRKAKSRESHHCSPLEQVGPPGAPRIVMDCERLCILAVGAQGHTCLGSIALPSLLPPGMAGGMCWQGSMVPVLLRQREVQPALGHQPLQHTWQEQAGGAAAAGEHCWGHRGEPFSLTNSILFSSCSLEYLKTLPVNYSLQVFYVCSSYSLMGSQRKLVKTRLLWNFKTTWNIDFYLLQLHKLTVINMHVVTNTQNLQSMSFPFFY